MEIEVKDKLTIGGKDYDVIKTEINQSLLLFYPENPRVYSALDVDSNEPDQKTIEEIMTSMEHVKQLKESIKANGGLIDPVIIRDKDFIVFEGNSRLAAYRLLAKEDPIKWGKIKCTILPENIPEGAVFQLLGQYHIIGRKDWSPYEQAGYLYRRIKKSKQSLEFIAKELGITKGNAENAIKVYEYMLENEDNHPEKWSYYEELLKNRNIRKYLETVDGLQDKINESIKNNEIKMALDIRNVFGGIAKVQDKESNKIMREIADGNLDIYEGYQKIEDDGKAGKVYQTLKKFRMTINEEDFSKRMMNESSAQIKFELSKIEKTINMLLKKFE